MKPSKPTATRKVERQAQSFQWQLKIDPVPDQDRTGKEALDGSSSESCAGCSIAPIAARIKAQATS